MSNAPQQSAPSAADFNPPATAADTPTDIFDRYAASIVSCYPHLYDTVEVHGVRNIASGSDNGTCYEIDNRTPTSFSVYVHLIEGGLDCVGDFGHYADAVQYGREVGDEYGWPVRNFVLDQNRTTTLASVQ